MPLALTGDFFRRSALTVRELDLPASYRTLVLSLRRLDAGLDEFRVIPDGSTRLVRGDRLVVLGPLDRIARLRAASGTDEGAA